MNSIDARVSFSFKGEDYSYASCIDLDALLCQFDEMPSLHALLARQHHVDTYSYLYEVMEAAEIKFSNPQGSAADHLVNDEFDPFLLADNWHSAKTDVLLQTIATRELGITDLSANQPLQRALIEAYNLGRKS